MIETRFKDTEIGLIPEDWEVTNIGSQCSLFGRIGFRGYTKNDLVDKGFGAITFSPSDIHDFHLDYSDCDYISFFKYEESPEIKVFNGDIIFCKTASIGKCALVEGLKEKATINPQFVVLKSIKCNNRLLFYVLVDKRFQDRILSITGGSTIPTMSQEKLKLQKFACPSTLEEQAAIASALSDVDELLRELGELIEKKKAIKMGMMQELLTVEAVPGKEGAFRPKRRLEGFEGDWKSYSFKELHKYASEGGTPDTSVSSYYQGGNIPFVKIEDTVNKYITSCKSFITEEGLAHSSAWMIPVNSVIFTNGATIGNVAINKIPVSTKQGILGIVPREIFDSEFLYYYLSSNLFLKEVHSRETVGTFAIITIGKMNEISVVFPSIKAEQTAIAEVLSDMDAEIAALEAKRAKYEQVKNGMMQELLTGKIRLV